MKRFFVILLLCAVVVTALCGTMTFASAEEYHDVTIALDVVKEGDELVATVILQENDGIVDMILRVEYDVDALELVERTYGDTLARLNPTDNFEAGAYVYPYRAIYVGDVTNSDDTGRLLILRFRVKEEVKDGEYPIKVIVRQVEYRPDADTDPIHNPKYGEPVSINSLDVSSSVTTGGVVVAEKLVRVEEGEVGSVVSPEDAAGKILMIVLISVGAVVFIGAIVGAYLFYRKKKADNFNK